MKFSFLSFRRVGVCSFGVGLCLNSWWSIGVAPVRGGTYFVCRRKESKQRKRLQTANVQAVSSHSHGSGTINERSPAQHTPVTRQSSVPAALRAPSGKQQNPPSLPTSDCSSPYLRSASVSVSASAPRRGEADGSHHAQTKPPVLSHTLPASTECEAGGMTALSLGLNVRGDGFQMVHYRGCAGDPLSISGVKRLSLPTFLAAAKKVGAAPHRGNANRPQRIQGKANKKSQNNPKRRSHHQRPAGRRAISDSGLGHALAPASPDPTDRKPAPARPGAMGIARRAGLDAPDSPLRRRHLRRHHLPRWRMGRPDRQNPPLGFPRPDRRSAERNKARKPIYRVRSKTRRQNSTCAIWSRRPAPASCN